MLVTISNHPTITAVTRKVYPVILRDTEKKIITMTCKVIHYIDNNEVDINHKIKVLKASNDNIVDINGDIVVDQIVDNVNYFYEYDFIYDKLPINLTDSLGIQEDAIIAYYIQRRDSVQGKFNDIY